MLVTPFACRTEGSCQDDEEGDGVRQHHAGGGVDPDAVEFRIAAFGKLAAASGDAYPALA
jgi:hypothetical protein